jgi:hypothetical protein
VDVHSNTLGLEDDKNTAAQRVLLAGPTLLNKNKKDEHVLTGQIPKHVIITRAAILLPTPGNFMRSSYTAGTLPLNSERIMAAHSFMYCVFITWRPALKIIDSMTPEEAVRIHSKENLKKRKISSIF